MPTAFATDAASADRIQVSYDEEATFGVKTSTVAYKELRLTSESLGQNTQSVASQEIRSDRQNVDVIRTGIDAGGDINFELSYETYDDFFRWALMNSAAAWPSTVVVHAGSVLISATAATNKFAISAGAWTNTPADNTWIKVSGFTGAATTANRCWKVLTGTDATNILVHQLGILVDDAEGESVVITGGSQLMTGTTFWSATIQKDYQDLDTPDVFEHLSGMCVNTMALNVPVDGVITGTFGMLGKDAVSATTKLDSAITAANSNEVMAAVEDVDYVFENSAVYASTAFTLLLNNNLRTRLQIGTLGAISVGLGTISLTGTLQAYFSSIAAMDRYLNFTSSNIAMCLTDSAGNTYILDVPEVKFTDGKRVAGGRNQDIMADLTWEAKKDPTEAETFRIVKFT